MGRTLFKIRIWIALVVAIASLGFTSSAFAMKNATDAAGGPTVVPQAPVVPSASDGFNWGDALVGAGVAFGVAALGGIGIAYVARSRTRLLA
jgi:hypothetical protein